MDNEYSPLDEVRAFIARYLAATDAQLDAITLWIASTHVLPAFLTHPRLLFTSHSPESGKSLALSLVMDLSHDGYDASGTSYALHAKLAEPTYSTMVFDEVSDIF